MDAHADEGAESEDPPSTRPVARSGGEGARLSARAARGAARRGGKAGIALLAAATLVAAAPEALVRAERAAAGREAPPAGSCRAEIVEDLPRTEDLADAVPRLRVTPAGRAFVGRWMSRLRGTSPRLLDAYLSRAEPWRDDLLPILRFHGLPEEFLYLPLLESGMDPEAVSPADAVGLWQFTDATARRYGLAVAAERDERRDGKLSTEAAGRYLRDLYLEFGSWELAAAAYNAGPGRVRRALRRSGGGTFWELAEAGALPAETRSYVPRFLALVELARAQGGPVDGASDEAPRAAGLPSVHGPS